MWILLGNFNAIRSLHEKNGSTTSWSGWQNDLNNCVIHTILKKLDRVLINVKWNCDFSGLETCFLTYGISSLSPILVKMASLSGRKIPFKFFDFWADHPPFLPLIFKDWCKEVMGTPMFVLCNKLKNVKRVLRDFNNKYFGKISDRKYFNKIPFS